ncbi:MAG TPA: ferrous iron transport protein A [Candidatus Enterocloster faecavium]|uniref:Ferrous iron transport protein A n=1 Tax=Candidatus Enterocloster faecavium TaxID=2838560 RepID=A0A9D2RJ63_9FIRM|nr:ferrous iron transport protein A [Candidatus Enterocloster faecavium]
MKLNQGKITGTYRVIQVNVQQDLKRRLEVLGMTGGTVLEVMNKKSGGTMIVKIRGTRFALGKRITENVEVEAS